VGAARGHRHRLLRWSLLRLLGRYHALLAEQGKISAADNVCDLMDEVYGFAPSHRRLT
jgi:hypothetical protein